MVSSSPSTTKQRTNGCSRHLPLTTINHVIFGLVCMTATTMARTDGITVHRFTTEIGVQINHQPAMMKAMSTLRAPTWGTSCLVLGTTLKMTHSTSQCTELLKLGPVLITPCDLPMMAIELKLTTLMHSTSRIASHFLHGFIHSTKMAYSSSR